MNIYSNGVSISTYSVVKSFENRRKFSIEGMVFDQDTQSLFESIGGKFLCELYQISIENGNISKSKNNCPGNGTKGYEWFGKGITELKGYLYQLTWRANKYYMIDKNNFQNISELVYHGEGWGLTTDGTNLITSDGTSEILFRDPKDMSILRNITVIMDRKMVSSLNELEYIRGEIWANLWYSTKVVRINPANGIVNSIIDFAGIYDGIEGQNILNGIAYDAKNNRIFITGRNWPYIYQVSVTIDPFPSNNLPTFTPDPSLPPIISGAHSSTTASDVKSSSNSNKFSTTGLIASLIFGFVLLTIGIYMLYKARKNMQNQHYLRAGTEMEEFQPE